eukprot:TRINITY_DN44216_c0_g1_i1.p2 TRINITY_DN44216_c0_g1~~TRINITY_DN44216_c0_g1_i1.p2  ORF type:complete len:102 (+),score=3.33 TRINITY_DN44216_c0_g1_i1:64-369(+)
MARMIFLGPPKSAVAFRMKLVVPKAGLMEKCRASNPLVIAIPSRSCSINIAAPTGRSTIQSMVDGIFPSARTSVQSTNNDSIELMLLLNMRTNRGCTTESA